MRNYKLTISYDGTNYQGWQRQDTTSETIQGILERAISDCLGYPITIDGSGRTDSGVHAYAQTATMGVSGKLEESGFLNEVNAKLPADIRIVRAELVKKGFHARKDAVGKCYEYRIDTRQKPNVFKRRYACHYPHELDVKAMKQAAAYLAGRHDFSGFTDKKDERSTVRTIHEIRIEMTGDMVKLTFTGTGFMYHMVRILTGTLLEVGTGEKCPQEIKEILKSGNRQRAGFLAPAKGLMLKEVYYESGEKKR